MAHAPEKRALLRSAYVHQRQPLTQACETAGVPLPTARRWKADADAEGDDWDKARSARALSGAGQAGIVQIVVEDYLDQHAAALAALKADTNIAPLTRAEILSRLADSFNKTMAAAAKASPELSRLAVANELIQFLAEFTRAKFPKHLGAIVELLEPFAAEAAKRFA